MRRILAVVALLAVSAGCTADAPEPDPAPAPDPLPDVVVDEEPDEPGGTLRVGLGVDPVSIDPRFVVDDEGELIVDALFDPLVRVDHRQRLVPAAAHSWEMDEEGLEFTFHLREATFHDGSPVTAEDFRRTFARVADGTAEPESYAAFLLAPVEGALDAQEGGELTGVEVVDERTLVVRLTAPQPGFVRSLSDPSLAPVPEVADDDLEAFAAQPVGNGPFALAEPREPGSFLRLTAYEDHHEPPRLDEVLFQIYPEDPTRERQWEDLLEGQLHVAEIPPDRMDEAVERFGESSDGYRGPGLLHGIMSTVYLYGFDVTQPPFDDPDVRRAISQSIDREALAHEVMQGIREPATSIVPPSLPGGTPGMCLHCVHDPAAAAALLEEAEIELEGFTLTHTRGRTHAAIAERMASDIESALGVEVDLAARDTRPFVQAIRRGEVPVFRLGWDANQPDNGEYLYPLFHSSQVGLDNLSRYADDEVDEMLEYARTTTSRAEELGYNREAERMILADAPVIPLLWYRNSRVVSGEVQDLYHSPLGRIDFAAVWLDPDA